MTACAKCGGDASSVSGKKKRCPHCNALKHECAPEEWSKIMSRVFMKRCTKKGVKRPIALEKTDEAIQAGWVETLRVAGSDSFDRNHDRAQAYVMTGVIWLYDSVIFSNYRWPTMEWEWKRNSAAADYAKLKKAGKPTESSERVMNGGSISLRTNVSLSQEVGARSGKRTKESLGERAGVMNPDWEKPFRHAEAVSDLRLLMERAKEVLSDRQYEAFMLRYNCQMTYPEIAERMTISKQRVKQLLVGDASKRSCALRKLGLPTPGHGWRIRKALEPIPPKLFNDL